MIYWDIKIQKLMVSSIKERSCAKCDLTFYHDFGFTSLFWTEVFLSYELTYSYTPSHKFIHHIDDTASTRFLGWNRSNTREYEYRISYATWFHYAIDRKWSKQHDLDTSKRNDRCGCHSEYYNKISLSSDYSRYFYIIV